MDESLGNHEPEGTNRHQVIRDAFLNQNQPSLAPSHTSIFGSPRSML